MTNGSMVKPGTLESVRQSLKGGGCQCGSLPVGRLLVWMALGIVGLSG